MGVGAFLLPPPRRICNRRCLSVCLLAHLHKNFKTDLHEIFREGWHWANEQMFKFWWRSRIPIRIAALVRRALAEVSTVPVLLVVSFSALAMLVGWVTGRSSGP